MRQRIIQMRSMYRNKRDKPFKMICGVPKIPLQIIISTLPSCYPYIDCISLQYTIMKNIFAGCIGFDWDDGNSEKNWILHQVSRNECEQVYFNAPIIVGDDIFHSQSELRWFLLGKTDNKHLLFIVFTIREKLIRIISARDMSKKERRIYYEKS